LLNFSVLYFWIKFKTNLYPYGYFLLPCKKKNKRYKPMLEAATLREQVEALGKSGYATDPKHAKKIMAIANSKRMEVL
jgi:flagellum-specific peptidoglycan hydrolase FlgJ